MRCLRGLSEGNFAVKFWVEIFIKSNKMNNIRRNGTIMEYKKILSRILRFLCGHWEKTWSKGNDKHVGCDRFT